MQSEVQTELNYVKGINRCLAAKITWQKVTYQLGSYKSIEEAVAVRQAVEKK